MIDIDITMPIQIVNILILIVIMNGVLYKPVRTILEQRVKKLADLDNEVETFDKNAQLRRDEFDTKINDARIKAKEELDAARGSAQSAGNEKLTAIRQEADAAKAEQLTQVRSDVAAAQQELKGQVDSFASEMAGKILGRAL
ncbi:MAG: ATP synthase F0 subunit B [Desulfobulbaceae bacterium]|nr:ATP synthase F0 subunit B [Desulfobulbaceae bacterium]MCK5404562.1 ATP synthase F0 subunit B [Desulfobulbaceae bacterium]